MVTGWRIMRRERILYRPVLKSHTTFIKTSKDHGSLWTLNFPDPSSSLLCRCEASSRLGDWERDGDTSSCDQGPPSSPPPDLCASQTWVKQTPAIHTVKTITQHSGLWSVTHKTVKCNFPSIIRWIQQKIYQTPSICRSHCWWPHRCHWLQWWSQSLQS